MALQEFVNTNPKLAIILLSMCVTIVMTLVTKYFTNQSRMKELKELQKACQIKLKDNKGNPEESAKIQKEMMACSMELMKHSFKPMFITLLPLLIFFWWIRKVFSATPLGGSWLWWYIGASIISSMVFRKVLKVV